MKPMPHEEFQLALIRLGWTQLEAAIRLGTKGGHSRVGEWARGDREIPPYIAAHVRTLLELRECMGENDL